MNKYHENMAVEDNIVVYQPDNTIQLEVRVENETVWLNRHQLAILFNRDIKTIGKHIKNALHEELADVPVVAIFATTAKDGKTYSVEYYNLDMVLSIGYRVKSSQGVAFRKWANEILRAYLLKGYSINMRFDTLENRIAEHEILLKEHSEKIDFFVRTSLPPTHGIFFDGQMFDAYVFAADLIRSASKSVVLIDNYVDETVLTVLDKRGMEVDAVIYTKDISKKFCLDLKKHNEQYRPVEVRTFTKAHDRFLLIDEKVYHLGASLKDLGRKWFAFSLMTEWTVHDIIDRIQNSDCMSQ